MSYQSTCSMIRHLWFLPAPTPAPNVVWLPHYDIFQYKSLQNLISATVFSLLSSSLKAFLPGRSHTCQALSRTPWSSSGGGKAEASTHGEPSPTDPGKGEGSDQRALRSDIRVLLAVSPSSLQLSFAFCSNDLYF